MLEKHSLMEDCVFEICVRVQTQKAQIVQTLDLLLNPPGVTGAETRKKKKLWSRNIESS